MCFANGIFQSRTFHHAYLQVAGSTPLHGVSARSDPLSIGYSLAVASLAGAANVMLTNPIWCAQNSKLTPHHIAIALLACDPKF